MESSKKESQAFVIALVTMAGGFASFYLFPGKDAVVIPLMTFVLGYYFGSSPGSHSKDMTIGDLAKTALRSTGNGSSNGNGVCLGVRTASAKMPQAPEVPVPPIEEPKPV